MSLEIWPAHNYNTVRVNIMLLKSNGNQSLIRDSHYHQHWLDDVKKPSVWRHSQLWSNPATSDANFRTAHACKLIEQAIAQDGMMINFKTENVSLSIRMYTFVYVTQTRARVIDDVAVPLTMSSECIMWHAYHKKYDNKTDGAHDVIIRLYIYIPPRFRARALSISMHLFNECDITVTAPL